MIGRSTRLTGVAACIAVFLAAGVVAAPRDCKPIKISEQCVIYDQGFCAYQTVVAGKGLNNLNGSCARWGKLEETDFTGIPEITDANWSSSQLRKTNLSGVVLSGTVFDEADITGTDFSNADLTGASLRGAKGDSTTRLRGAKLNQAILDEADLTGVAFEGVELTGASMIMTNLTGADLRGVILESLDLSGADLSSAILEGATLKGAKLSGAKFTEANLRDADLGTAEVDDATDFTAAVLCNTTMPDGSVDNSGCQ